MHQSSARPRGRLRLPAFSTAAVAGAVLLALSGADRRRQRELDVPRHLLECELCTRLSEPLLERGPARTDEVHVTITADPDIVAARQAARELAARAGFAGTDLTMLATAVSEVARNIVRFAESGEVSIELLERPRPMTAATRGFGEAIVAALDAGVDRLVLGIGSSASTDGGAGMLAALGASLRDGSGAPVGAGASGLSTVAAVDLGGASQGR